MFFCNKRTGAEVIAPQKIVPAVIFVHASSSFDHINVIETSLVVPMDTNHVNQWN